MTRRNLLTNLLLILATVATALGAGVEEQFYTIELVDATIDSTAPVRVAAGQTALATVWDHDGEPVRIAVIDAETGAVLSEAETKPAGSYQVAVKFPWVAAQTRYVMFQADGKPMRAKVQIRLVDARSAAESLKASWGRTFEFGQARKAQTLATEPMVLTEAHTLGLRLFNRGGRAAVTVHGWDYVSKQRITSKTVIVEGRRGTKVEIPGATALGMAPLIPGAAANGLLQLEVVVEPLDGPADLVMTAEGQSSYGEITLKRGITATDDLWQ